MSSGLIKIVLIILSLFLIFPAMSFALIMLSIGICMIISLIAFVIGIPFIFKLIIGTPQIAALSIFMSIGFIGVQILAWQIYIIVFKICKDLIKTYVNWIKTRKIYISASEKKDKLKKEDFYDEGEIKNREGDDINE